MSTSIFVGHAKPPSNTVSGQMYTILSVVCEVDMDTGVIAAELERCYFSGTQKALIQCFRDMAKRFRAQAGASRPDAPAV